MLRLLCIPAGLFLAAAVALAWDGLHDDLRPADYGVVLGNKIGPDGMPSARLKARLDRAVALYQEGLFPAIIVSGGVGVEGFDEAAVMRQYLTARGIPADRVIGDNQGLTTFDTAKNTVRILRHSKGRSVLVVSQFFHISRSVLAMKRCGVSEVYSAHAHWFEWRDLYSLAREVPAYAQYAVE